MLFRIFSHAIRKKTFSENKEITDSFPECKGLFKKTKAATFYLMNKKSKGRFAKYKK